MAVLGQVSCMPSRSHRVVGSAAVRSAVDASITVAVSGPMRNRTSTDSPSGLVLGGCSRRRWAWAMADSWPNRIV